MENNYVIVMLWNLSVISHLIFPQCSFLFLAPNLKKKKKTEGARSTSLLREHHQNKIFFEFYDS